MKSTMRVLLAIGIVSAMAGGCSKSETASTQPAAGKQVTAYMYSEYIDPEIVKAFEDETGLKLRIDVYDSTEEMMGKLQQAGAAAQYDVMVVSDHAIPILVKLGLIKPLDKARIANAKNVDKRFADPPYDRGNKHSLPYQWGTVGLMYRKDKVTDKEPSWSWIFDEARQPGPFVLIDSMRDMMGAALKAQGKSVNSRKPDELKAAGELILKAKKSDKCLGFEGGVGGKNKVVSGDAVLAIVYNGDALRAITEDKSGNLDFALPREGTEIWVDAMTVSAQAPNPDGAHRFIDFILRPDVGAQLSNFNQYATPNAAAMADITEEDRTNPIIYPAEEDINRMEYLEDVGGDTKLFDEIWTSVKSR